MRKVMRNEKRGREEWDETVAVKVGVRIIKKGKKNINELVTKIKKEKRKVRRVKDEWKTLEKEKKEDGKKEERKE